MKLKEAIQILEQHNKWRRDNSIPPKLEMQNPKQLGIAIDVIIKHLKK